MSASEKLIALAEKEEWRSHTPQTLACLALDVEGILPALISAVETLERIRDEQREVMTHTGPTHTSRYGFEARVLAQGVLAALEEALEQ